MSSRSKRHPATESSAWYKAATHPIRLTPPHAISVPHIAYQHSLGQYRTSRGTLDTGDGVAPYARSHAPRQIAPYAVSVSGQHPTLCQYRTSHRNLSSPVGVQRRVAITVPSTWEHHTSYQYRTTRGRYISTGQKLGGGCTSVWVASSVYDYRTLGGGCTTVCVAYSLYGIRTLEGGRCTGVCVACAEKRLPEDSLGWELWLLPEGRRGGERQGGREKGRVEEIGERERGRE
eukprot:3941957-Rhodomonas_salina.1